MAARNYDLMLIRKKVKKNLDHERYEHTKGVMYTCGCLAMAFGQDMEQAMVAGLLHDCAKCIPHDEKIRICKTNHMDITAVEYDNPGLLHAKCGAILAQKKYGINDKDIIHAIKVHTTGEPAMTTLDKILYIADYIEPNRDQAPRLEYIRQLAFEDLDACIAAILFDTLNYLATRKGTVDPTTQMTYEYYKQYLKEE